MQLALTILAGFGALLFIISFIAYVISGFRHHFVTGLISMLPVLNIVTLPSLWDRSSKKFIVGLIGLIITIGAWFMGADKGIQNLIKRDKNTVEEVVLSSAPNDSGVIQQSSNTNIAASKAIPRNSNSVLSFDESDMSLLPNKALYKMGFEVVPINQINTLQGRIVQITKNSNEMFEGRIKNIVSGSVILDGTFESEIPIASIKELKLMVKKAN